ncbi:MAG: hypothetical protein IJH99_08765 [Eubacterium sp.]|nr:hypothetical protein [Eubacterium sp.]
MNLIKKTIALLLSLILIFSISPVYADMQLDTDAIYKKGLVEIIEIDNTLYSYAYSLDETNCRVITITNLDDNRSDIVKYDRNNGIISLNNNEIGKMEIIFDSNESETDSRDSQLRGWTYMGSDSQYITWGMAVAMGVLAAIIAAAAGGIGAAAVIACMGASALGVLASAAGGGTVYVDMYFQQYTPTTSQFKEYWKFVASTGDSYGYYEHYFPIC